MRSIIPLFALTFLFFLSLSQTIEGKNSSEFFKDKPRPGDASNNNGTAQESDSLGCVTIDFELVPGDTVIEGLLISDQFFDSLGISFKLEDSTFMFPRIAEVGAPRTAFGASFGPDTPAPGQNIGTYFLTDDGLTSGLEAQPLIVDFNYPADSISGYVLDIDYNETFTIELRDSMEQVIDSMVITTSDTGTGDGLASFWSFKRDDADIYSLRFEGTRTAAGYFGLGFDNFCSCSPSRITSAKTSENINQPKSFLLEQNFPNPFNPATTINYQLPKSAQVELTIYNLLGQKVTTLVSTFQTAGEKSVVWDGTNAFGEKVGSGIYFYHLQAGDFIETRKMLLAR